MFSHNTHTQRDRRIQIYRDGNRVRARLIVREGNRMNSRVCWKLEQPRYPSYTYIHFQIDTDDNDERKRHTTKDDNEQFLLFLV